MGDLVGFDFRVKLLVQNSLGFVEGVVPVQGALLVSDCWWGGDKYLPLPLARRLLAVVFFSLIMRWYYFSLINTVGSNSGSVTCSPL